MSNRIEILRRPNNELSTFLQVQVTLTSSLFPALSSSACGWMKSDIVSLRLDVKSSAGLSIVGGTESELKLINGRETTSWLHYQPSSCSESATSQQVLITSFQTWVSTSSQWHTPKIVFLLNNYVFFDCTLMEIWLKSQVVFPFFSYCNCDYFDFNSGMVSEKIL